MWGPLYFQTGFVMSAPHWAHAGIPRVSCRHKLSGPDFGGLLSRVVRNIQLWLATGCLGQYIPAKWQRGPPRTKAMSGVNNVISTWWGPLYRLVKLMYHWRDSSRWILKKSQTSELLGSLSCYLAWNSVLTFWFYLALLSLSLNPTFLVK